MDKASQVLAQGVPPGVRTSYRALAGHSQIPHTNLHHRARGRRSMEEKAQSQQYLTPWEEKALVKFLLQMSDLGQPIRIKFIRFLAFVATRQQPATHQPLKPPGKNWAKAFKTRHPEMAARQVMALDWNRHEKNILRKITHWFEVIEKVLDNPAILAENVYNMDKTGVMLLMLSSVKVLVGKGNRRNYRGARVKRTTITAIKCISADSRYLNLMIVWPATTYQSNWTTFPTPGWQYACNESGYIDSNISLQWLKRTFNAETKDRANGRPRVLILDGFGTHEALEILEYCFANNIILCHLPSYTSHKLQPCDVAVFAPLKTAYREQVERLERGGVNTLGKEHFTSLNSPARERAFTPNNIKAGFAASGLFPFNPERVLRTMPKPAAGLTVSITNEASCRQDSVPQGDAVLPQTPVTPVSAEGLMSLQSLILERDAHALDERSKQSLQRHLLKFDKAAQLSFTKGALQQNHIHLLMSINNEAKPRRLTKSEILAKGTGKVMSYEDLQEARTKRAEKDAAKEAIKEKRDQKRKTNALEAEANALDVAGPSVPKGKEKRGRKRKSIAPARQSKSEAQGYCTGSGGNYGGGQCWSVGAEGQRETWSEAQEYCAGSRGRFIGAKGQSGTNE